MIRIACAGALLAFAGSASADVFLLNGYSAAGSPTGVFRVPGTGVVEARFKADTTNWDSRLASDGFPTPGEAFQMNVNNGSQFNGTTYSFALSFDASATEDQISWSITNNSTMAVTTTFIDAPDAQANVIRIFTNGQSNATGSQAGGVDISNLTFNGLGESLGDTFWPDFDASPTTTSFVEYLAFFGNDADLYTSGDWSLTGNLNFVDLAGNPGERAKITVRIESGETFDPIIPGPGGLALAGVGLLAGHRRRRA